MQRIRNTFRRKRSSCFDKEALQATRSLPPDICQAEKELSPAYSPDLLDPNWDAKHSRSISCDEIIIKEVSASTTLLEMAAKEAQAVDNSLDVPSNKSQRSKSLDSSNTSREPRGSTAFLEIPKWRLLIRKPSVVSTTSSSSDSIYFTDCIHCVLIDNYCKTNGALPPSVLSSVSLEIWKKSAALLGADSEQVGQERESGQLSAKDGISSADEGGPQPDNLPIFKLSAPTISITIEEDVPEDPGSGITVVSLEVPVTGKQNRSASVDSSFLQVPNRTDIIGEPPPAKSHRSRSVDIALPVGPDGPYLVVPNVETTQLTTK